MRMNPRSCAGRPDQRQSDWVSLLLTLWTTGSAWVSPGARIHWVDVRQDSGVEMVVDNSESDHRYQIEPMIAGVALFDFDGDGLLDLYLCNGAELPSLEKSSPRFWNRLYRNRGDFRFLEVTQTAGVAGQGYSMGAAAGDFDNDGSTDLYVTGVNRNILYRNLGDGRFEDVTGKAGVSGEWPGRGKLWSVGAGWFDYDHDGDLDLLVVNYCDWGLDREHRCGADQPGYRTYCHPRFYHPLPNMLYRNNGDGTFTDVSLTSGIGRPLGKGMGLAFADYDGDGFLDVFVSNDAWRNFLFRNRGDGTFEEVALHAGVAYVDSGRPVSGMGADFRDLDEDGHPDIFMTALSNETFPIFRNLGNGLLRDVRFSSGLGIHSMPWGGWSLGMVEADNDGLLDLFVAGGHVQTNEELYTGRQSRQTNRLFHNRGAALFQDISEDAGPAFRQLGLHRGAAFGDLDNDGRIDAVVTRLNEPVEILQNRTEGAGHYLSLRLEGTAANRDGIGAMVRLRLPSGRELVRHVTTAVGYGGSSDRRLHFGLGAESRVTNLDIVWPGGKRQSYAEIAGDQFLHFLESAGKPVAEPP